MLDKIIVPLLIFLLFFSLPFLAEKKDSKPLQKAELSQSLEIKTEKIEPKKEKDSEVKEKEKLELEKEKKKRDEKRQIQKEIKNQPELCQKNSLALPTQDKVIINEIAWMGMENSANDEWLELKNISSQEINLSSWQLIDKEGDLKIIFPDLELAPNQYLLLERSNDETIAEIPADLIYQGVLSNENEALYLFDQNCQLQDLVEANPFWPAGNKDTKQTMERKSDFSWQTSLNIGGTPKKENSFSFFIPTPTPVFLPTPTSTPIPTPVSLPTPIPTPSPTPPSVFSFCSQENLSSASHFPVIFNEIAWMGTHESSRNEWFELKNLSENLISLEGWQILDKDSQIKIVFDRSAKILPFGYFLLERTDDNTLPQIPADFIYQGALSDHQESLRLFDQNCHLIDEVLADPDWPAGQKEEKRSMERKEDLSWQTYQGIGQNNIFATPKKENSQASSIPIESQNPPFSVVINEIAWMGTKASANDEWIELFNNSEKEINFEGWTLEAEDGSPKISLTGKIPAKGFYLLERTSDETIKDILADLIYKGALSNDGEVLILRDKEGNIVDKVSQWYGGENSTKKTMERIDPKNSGDDSGNWASNNGNKINGLDAKGNPIFGTPKSKNSQSI